MHGSLCLAHGVLYVGRHAQSAAVTAYDLDGRRLQTIASFRDEEAGRSSAAGLSVDADHRLWVADHGAGHVRGYSLFGVEVVRLPSESREDDRAGALGRPVDVLALGSDEELVLVVASSGRRRHAVQVLEPEGARQLSLRPLGDPQGRFEDVVAIAARGERELLVLEAAARRIQVFRGGHFHFSIDLRGVIGEAWPSALAVSSEGHIAIAASGPDGGVWLCDDNGRALGQVAQAGEEEGQVQDVCAVAFEAADGLQPARWFVMDRTGDRVQVFTHEGRCYGAFPALVS